MFQDLQSVVLEKKLHEWEMSGRKAERFLVDPTHWIDFKTMRMINAYDNTDTRRI